MSSARPGYHPGVITPRRLAPILLLLAGCSAPEPTTGLREGEQGFERRGYVFFDLGAPDPSRCLIVTAVRKAGPEGQRTPDVRHGLITGTHQRLLEPEWSWIDVDQDPCVYTSRESGSLWRHVLGPGPTVVRSEQTPYFTIDPVHVPPDHQTPPPGVRGFALPLHLGSRVDRLKDRYWDHTVQEIDLLDGTGRHLATLTGWHPVASRAYLHGNTVVVTHYGRIAADMSVDLTDSTTSLVGPDGEVSARLPRLVPFACSGRSVLAFETGRRAPGGAPLYWPLDPSTGLPQVDGTGSVTGFELVGRAPDDVASGAAGKLTAWIVHADGPRAGLELPGGSLATGLRWRSVEAVSIEGHDATAFLAERLDGTWVCLLLLGTGSGAGARGLGEHYPSATRQAVLDLVKRDVAEGAQLAREAYERWQAEQAALARQAARRRTGLEAELEAYLARGAAGADEGYGKALGAAEELGARARARLLRHAWTHLPRYRASWARELEWVARGADGSPRPEDVAWARDTHGAVVEQVRRAQLAAEEEERAREAQRAKEAGAQTARQPADQGGDDSAYLRRSAEHQRYVQALDAYTRGRQDWYYSR